MISFKNFKEDWIGLNRYQDNDPESDTFGHWFSSPMTREEYYKKHCQDSKIEDFYNQLVMINNERSK